MTPAAQNASEMRARDLLARACNPLRTPHDRRMAWDAYEIERDYLLVCRDGLRLCDLEPDHRDAVYRLIVERGGCAPLR